jgi:drug/metabolite transporter (DMT)-like permease
MTMEILLALVASVFTATSSVAQRVAAAPAPGELSFSWRLLLFLLRRPMWFFGIVCMILGFAFQLAALHIGDLSLVQPVIATELLFVFAYLALRNHHQVHVRDWIAALGMAAGLGGFLALAAPRGGNDHTDGMTWLLAGIATYGAAFIIAGLASANFGKGPPSPARKAALLAIAAGIAWGFVAAVIKELSTHISAGPYAVFTNWSPYALLLTGAAAMFLLSNAFQAGPLAASQPGLTIVDPLVASLLGVTVFGEHIRHAPFDLLGEAVCLGILVSSVILLSRSTLIKTDNDAPKRPSSIEPPDDLAAKARVEPGGSPNGTNGTNGSHRTPRRSIGRRHRGHDDVARPLGAAEHIALDPPAR